MELFVVLMSPQLQGIQYMPQNILESLLSFTDLCFSLSFFVAYKWFLYYVFLRRSLNNVTVGIYCRKDIAVAVLSIPCSLFPLLGGYKALLFSFTE